MQSAAADSKKHVSNLNFAKLLLLRYEYPRQPNKTYRRD